MPVTTQTFEGVPGGMNLALPANEIQDTEARYLQDILLDYPGLVRRRGPLSSPEGFAALTRPATGLVYTLDPSGANRMAVLTGNASNGYLDILDETFTSVKSSFPWNGALPTAPPTTPYRLVDSKGGLTGGAWIGTSSQYNANGPVQNLALWRGGVNADYSTGTITLARGSTSVTGVGTLWTANASPGMYLFSTTDDGYTLAYVGVVKTVNSDTSITLGDVSLYPATAKAYKLTSIRGFAPRIVKGRITTNATSTTVTGANTKFISQGMNSGTWNLYRASDYTWIGKVASVINDTSCTLAANATIALNNENYVAFRADADMNISTMSSTSKVGFLNATYSERNWYANNGQQYALTSRVYFSDPSDPEAVDMSPFDGDYINVASSTGINSPITGLMPAYNALIVFKENETFGIYGSTTTTFQVKKIEDDGALCNMSVQPYGGGVIWAGREGIHFYDGIQAQNITAGNLGDWYKRLVRIIDPSKYRMWSMMSRDHYFLFLENCDNTKPIIKGAVSSSGNTITLVINMVSRAVTAFTNFDVRGGVIMPASTGLETMFIVNDASVGNLCSSTHIFDDEGNDTITCSGSVAGPDFYFESKKYNMGDSLLLKLFKEVLLNYFCQGDKLNVDTVLGLNDIGTTLTSSFPATIYSWSNLPGVFGTWAGLSARMPTWDQLIVSVFEAKRLRFLKRSQNFSFRIYQNSTNVVRLRLGPFQIGFKKLRPGRI